MSSELDKTLLGFTVSWRYFELKVSEDGKKTLLILTLIVVNLLSSSILQVEQQKVTGFFPTLLCYSRNVLFTDYMQLVDSLCSFHDQF